MAAHFLIDGSSPLMQGTAGPQRPGLSRAGVIPAHAGKGQTGYRHGQSTRIIPARAGRLAFIIGHHRIRIIPAGAGNGLRAGHPTSGGPSPPVRGNAGVPASATCTGQGHPRKSGKPAGVLHAGNFPMVDPRACAGNGAAACVLHRAIPARAGKRSTWRRFAALSEVHPRQSQGTSFRPSSGLPCRRFIPACAGKMRPFNGPLRSSGTSPRVQGSLER